MTDQQRIAGLEANFFDRTDYVERAAVYDGMARERQTARHTRRFQRTIFALVLLAGLSFTAWLQQTPDAHRPDARPLSSISETTPFAVEMSPKLLAVLDLSSPRRSSHLR